MSQRHVLMRKSGQSRPCQCRVLLRRPRRRRKKADQVARCRQSGPAAVRRAQLAWPQRRRLVCARTRRCQSVQSTSTTSRTWKSIRATARPRPSTLGRPASAGTTAGSDLARPSSSRSPSSRVHTAIEPPPHRLRTAPAPPLHTAPAPPHTRLPSAGWRDADSPPGLEAGGASSLRDPAPPVLTGNAWHFGHGRCPAACSGNGGVCLPALGRCDCPRHRWGPTCEILVQPAVARPERFNGWYTRALQSTVYTGSAY